MVFIFKRMCERVMEKQSKMKYQYIENKKIIIKAKLTTKHFIDCPQCKASGINSIGPIDHLNEGAEVNWS